jgi:hypothetical protein
MASMNHWVDMFERPVVGPFAVNEMTIDSTPLQKCATERSHTIGDITELDRVDVDPARQR